MSEAVLSLLKVSQVPALVALNKDLSLLGMGGDGSLLSHSAFLDLNTCFFLIKLKVLGLIERLRFIG